LAVLGAFTSPAHATPADLQFEIHLRARKSAWTESTPILIATAKMTIDLASYSFTDPPFATVTDRAQT
jgi:hypothetical protein